MSRESRVFARPTPTKPQEWLFSGILWVQESLECNLLREAQIRGKPDAMDARSVVETVLSFPRRLVNRILCCHSLVRNQLADLIYAPRK